MGFSALIISALAALIAGVTLSGLSDFLEALPGLIVLIPAAMAMRGNIFGAMGSRLGTAMHLGTFEMSFKKGTVLRSNTEAAIALTLILSFVIGVLAWLVTLLFGISAIGLVEYVFISVLGGVLAGIFLLALNIIIAYQGHLREWDVDNITAPLIGAAGDIITLPMLFLSAWIVLNAPETLIDLLFAAFTAATLLLIYHYTKVYNKDRDETHRILYESSPVLIICILMNIFAGLILETELESLISSKALLILLPAFLNEANGLGGILTSRLSSALHLGLMKADRAPRKRAQENFFVIYLFYAGISLLIAVLAHTISELLGMGSPGLMMMIAISLVAGFLTVTALNFIAYYVAILTYRHGLNPDDHSIPLTASGVDLIGTMFFVLMVLLLGI
ncbi:MAG: mgtE-like transporter [Candidatus Methanomethylophilaceae archaeon]|nr:mgtE-like transporter [Candidatus Methanomethylophilaceae archaeon]